jgi:hypothetical protein
MQKITNELKNETLVSATDTGSTGDAAINSNNTAKADTTEVKKPATVTTQAAHSSSDPKDTLAQGWADDGYGEVYHFEHYPLVDAERDATFKEEQVFLVETIHWGLVNANTVHRNKYFIFGLRDAIALATRIQIDAVTIAEEVVDIRSAEPEEADYFFEVLVIRETLPKYSLTTAVAQASARETEATTPQ